MSLIAQNWKDVFGTISPPDAITKIAPADTTGETTINTILNRSVELIFVLASVAFVIMFIWGATQMILSGGDKESVAKARARITWAIIGIVVLSLSFLAFRIVGEVTGFRIAP